MKTKKDKKEAIEFLTDLVFKVGSKTLKAQKSLGSLKITSKDRAGIASSADLAAEKMITNALSKKYPQIEILGEEQAYERFGDRKEAYLYFKKLDLCWVVDPIDGTNNFVNGLDYFAISIALTCKGKPILGAVYRPGNGDLFYAVKDEYSRFRNLKDKSSAKNLFVGKNKKTLANSMLASNFCKRYGPDLFDQEFGRLIKLIHETRSLRRFGSAALDMCYLASGQIDGYWENKLSPWDTAAAGLICEQAGVKVTDFKGRAFDPYEGSIVAARRPLYSKLKKFF